MSEETPRIPIGSIWRSPDRSAPLYRCIELQNSSAYLRPIDPEWATIKDHRRVFWSQFELVSPGVLTFDEFFYHRNLSDTPKARTLEIDRVIGVFDPNGLYDLADVVSSTAEYTLVRTEDGEHFVVETASYQPEPEQIVPEKGDIWTGRESGQDYYVLGHKNGRTLVDGPMSSAATRKPFMDIPDFAKKFKFKSRRAEVNREQT